MEFDNNNRPEIDDKLKDDKDKDKNKDKDTKEGKYKDSKDKHKDSKDKDKDKGDTGSAVRVPQWVVTRVSGLMASFAVAGGRLD